jgi:pimeloyl-ACP methyl ester carboxylesterase
LTPRTNDHVEVGGYRIWVEVEGADTPTVVFETGNGNDSGVWAEIAPRIRAAGATTFLHDRAGMGRSEAGPQPYSIDDEVQALRSALTSCGIEGPLVLAAHSYGGFISLLLASLDERVAGVVLVDANIPAFFTDAEVAAILAEYRPRYQQLREQAPELAATLIPIMEAYPATAARLRSVAIPARLPIVDIVAEHSWAATPASAIAMSEAHTAFVAHSSARESVFAAGSSHNVMRDAPDLVVGAIVRMLGLVAASGA